MVAGFDDALVRIVSRVGLIGALLLSLVVVTRFSDDGSLLAPLRKRFVLGVPWGTVIVILLVYAVYRVVQGGGEPGGPIVVGFRSWSLWYPQGLLLSSFSHSSESHLIGNLLGTVAFAPIVEYAWSHYPRQRGSQSFSSWRTNPFVRIGVVVVATVLVGIGGALFVPGAVIGFSGVVFAFAGFALVTRPITTVLAILGIQVVSLVRRAFVDPWSVAVAQPEFSLPSGANTALQGHLFGLFVGIVLAVAVVRYRGQWPKLRHIWFAVLVFAVSRSMHAVYWFLSADEFVFFRALGTAGVLVMASLVALAALSRDRPLVARIDLPVRTAAVGLLLAVVCALALVAVPYNLAPVTPGDATADGIQVRDYTVTYAEDAENKYISALELPVVRESMTVNMSGVIVTSDRRNVWELDTSAGRLAFNGRSLVVLGDATWRDTVYINRTEWALTGGNTTYKVFGTHGDDPRRLLFAAEPALARPIVNGSRISIEPAEQFYDVAVRRNGSRIGAERIPSHNDTVAIGGITFAREGQKLIAIHERTVVEIAKYRLDRRPPQ
jgi:membrane associated rhomboid family serine protease